MVDGNVGEGWPRRGVPRARLIWTTWLTAGLGLGLGPSDVLKPAFITQNHQRRAIKSTGRSQYQCQAGGGRRGTQDRVTNLRTTLAKRFQRTLGGLEGEGEGGDRCGRWGWRRGWQE